jgi:hypothetical protein
MRGFKLIVAGVALGVTACAPILSTVRMRGDTSDLATLTGKWNGEYRSPELGRSGSIMFRFADPGDVAYGDVAMVVPSDSTLLLAGNQPMVRPRFRSEILKLKFVNIINGEIFGVLEPYTDPSCECTVRTTFTGRFDGGSTIRGTFSTTSPLSSSARTGTWKVVRQ